MKISMSGRGFVWTEQNSEELKALIRTFKRAQGRSETSCGRVLVITGAGCSASAGIPTARQIAQKCAVDLWRNYGGSCEEVGEDPEVQATAAVMNLVKQGDLPKEYGAFGQEHPEPPWSELYRFFFDKVYESRLEQNEIVKLALKDGRLNWAHACLGELMRQRFVHTVLTVNFDLLALEGAVRAGVIPVVADGFEALSRVCGAPVHPQLVYLHGTCHNYTMRNSARDVDAIVADPDAILAVGNLLRESQCILVVGYSASDNGLARLLQKFKYDNRLVWAAFDTQAEKLSPQARAIRKSWNAKMLWGVDADGLFRELLRGIGLGAPEWMMNPASILSEAAKRLVYNEDTSIKEVVEGYKKRIALYGALLMDKPDPIGLELSLAANQRLAGKDTQAIRTLRKLRSRNPKSPQVLRALGETLAVVGKRRAKGALLTEAAKTLKEYLEVSPQRTDDDKYTWAQTQTLLGHTLIDLGENEEGLVHSGDAVAAFRAALKVHTGEGFRLDWAKGQNDLGIALRTRADWEEGTASLRRAIKAFRSALVVYTCEKCPDHWATAQTNLGEALTTLGVREEKTVYLKKAVSALLEVLQVRTGEGLRPAWAKTQHYLGDALRNLGTREGGEAGKAHLEEAVLAYERALTVRTRKRQRLYWARTQDRLGRVLASLGSREEGTSRLKEAVKAYFRALEVRSRKDPTRDWADTQCNLSEALLALGKREESSARLKEAIMAARAVLDGSKPISATYTARAQSVLERTETALRVRQEEC